MKKFLMAAGAGTLAGVIVTTQIAAPLMAQESKRNTSVYEQLDLFGDIFERRLFAKPELEGRAKVASMSVVEIVSFDVMPGLILLGHLATKGTR